MHRSELALIFLTGLLLYQVVQGSLYMAIGAYLATGGVWVYRMRELPRWNHPEGLYTGFGTLQLFLLWPLGAYYFYSARLRYRAKRYEIYYHEASSSEDTREEKLATFATLEEALADAKRRAAEDGRQINVYDCWANRSEPYIYYVLQNGLVYKLEAGGGMAELRQGRWYRV